MADNDWNPSLYQEKHKFVFEYGKDLLALLAPKPGERILDIGCGTGQLTKAIADLGAEVVGLDYSAEMIAAAKENYPEIEFVVADASDFTFDEPFDAVFSNAALHWVSRAENAAQCIAVVLKDGGRFVAEFGGKDNVGKITRAIRQILFDGYQLDINHPWYYPSIGEYATLLEKTGLAVDAAWLFDRETALEGEDGMRNWVKMFCEGMLADIPEDAREKVLSKLELRLRDTNYQDGKWFADYRRLRIKAHKTESL